jgi:hypothetical protein
MKKVFYQSIFVMGLGIGIFSCIKEDSLPTRYTAVPETNTFIRFHAFSPDAPQINYLINGSKATAVSPTTDNKEQGMIFPSAYPATVGYVTAASGSLKIDATVPSTSTVTPGVVIATTTQNFAANKYYSYFMADSLSKITTTVVEDDPALADVTKAYFRLANFVSNGSSVKIEILKTSTGTPYSKTYPAVAFKSVTAFEELEASPAIYKIYLRHPTTDAKLDSISAFTPSATKKYTIYTRGVLGLTGTNTKRPIISQYANF